MTNQILTQDILKEHLHYDAETGVFTWIKKTSIYSSIEIGNVAGGINNEGYLHIRIFNKKYKAHRLAWLYFYGEMPKDQIDHINGIRSDNRICNLRESDFSKNNQNRIKRLNCTSSYMGVDFHKASNKWRSRIFVNKKNYNLGFYETPEEAYQAYVLAKAKYHTFNPVMRES